MMKVYLDNAATTPLDPEAFKAMTPYLVEHYGNPSSIHGYGRVAKSAVEKARKKIADLLGAAPSEIFFTSGGSEADNMAIRGCVAAFGIKHAVSSKIEHHAVLHTLETLRDAGTLSLHFVDLEEDGQPDLDSLKRLLEKHPGALVSLMHGNNEIGNITDIAEAADICGHYNALLHSDTVQTVGHEPLNVGSLPVFSLAGSAHKFHGPKGAGFIYINGRHQIAPLISGGAQERNMRGGTENVAGIVGMARALEIACADMEKTRAHTASLKKRLAERLQTGIPGVIINGKGPGDRRSLSHILNVSVPRSEDNDMLLFNLDINNISVSAGSACTSGTNIGSHVLEAIGADPEKGAIRFSFSKYNTPEEIDYVADKLIELYSK